MKQYKLAHYIASCGVCSRREAERLIEDGRVQVNGLQLRVAERVSENDQVTLDGRLLKLLEDVKLFAYYKPVLSLVSHAPEPGKKTVFELVEDRVGRVLSVGRLDFLSEGLLLLTNSNKLCSELMHSSMPRTYKMLLSDGFNRQMEEFLSSPFEIDGIRYKPWKVENYHNNWLTVTLIEGKNREIRRVCEFLGLIVKRLIRMKFGPYKLTGQPDDLIEVVIKS